MPRIRTIKPEFFTDEGLADVSIYARFIYPGLWCFADCEGRLEDRPRFLKSQLLPYDDADMDALLGELAVAGMIMRYEVDGVRLISIPNFLKHQRLSGQEAQSSSCYPEPTEEALGKHLGSNHEAFGKDKNPRKGKERKGKELEGKGEGGRARGSDSAVETTFLPPTQPEVVAYFAGLGVSSAEADNFWLYYDGNGWMLGTSKMRSWKSTAQRWIKRIPDFERARGAPSRNGKKSVTQVYKEISGHGQ